MRPEVVAPLEKKVGLHLRSFSAPLGTPDDAPARIC